jgi:hypothetical protein
MKLNRRGQIFTIDLLIALFIFTLIFTSVVIFLYSVGDTSNPLSSYYSEVSSTYLSNIATQAANTLTGSPGYPSSWPSLSCPQISTLGVMYNSNEVSGQKLYNLTTLPVGCVSQLLRAGNSFNITAYYLNGSILRINGRLITAGFATPHNANYIDVVQRYEVLYPGTVIIRISLKEWI